MLSLSLFSLRGAEKRALSTRNLRPRASIFFGSLKEFHSLVDNDSHFEIHLCQEGCQLRLEKGQTRHQSGGRFIITFDSNTITFRNYCIFAANWLEVEKVGDDILGIMFSVNKTWCIQVWVNDGRSPDKVEELWTKLIEWIREVSNQDISKVRIEFQVHQASNRFARWADSGRMTPFVDRKSSYASAHTRAQNNVPTQDRTTIFAPNPASTPLFAPARVDAPEPVHLPVPVPLRVQPERLPEPEIAYNSSVCRSFKRTWAERRATTPANA